jgi:hypothetical protein
VITRIADDLYVGIPGWAEEMLLALEKYLEKVAAFEEWCQHNQEAEHGLRRPGRDAR